MAVLHTLCSSTCKCRKHTRLLQQELRGFCVGSSLKSHFLNQEAQRKPNLYKMMNSLVPAREEFGGALCVLPHQSSFILWLLGTRNLVLSTAPEGNMPEASHHPAVGMSRWFLELPDQQEEVSFAHANFSFQTKIKKWRDFCCFFVCFPVTLVLMQPDYFVKMKMMCWVCYWPWYWLKLRASAGRLQEEKYQSWGGWADLGHLMPGPGMGSTRRHFYMHQLTKRTPAKKIPLMMG